MQIWSALMDEINVRFEGKGKSNSGSLLHRGDQEPIEGIKNQFLYSNTYMYHQINKSIN